MTNMPPTNHAAGHRHTQGTQGQQHHGRDSRDRQQQVRSLVRLQWAAWTPQCCLFSTDCQQKHDPITAHALWMTALRTAISEVPAWRMRTHVVWAPVMVPELPDGQGQCTKCGCAQNPPDHAEHASEGPGHLDPGRATTSAAARPAWVLHTEKEGYGSTASDQRPQRFTE